VPGRDTGRVALMPAGPEKPGFVLSAGSNPELTPIYAVNPGFVGG
jgi:hypothetical protein